MFTFPTGLFVPSQTGDPFWANVVFLQNFQGTNGSKPTTDQSQYAHTLTWNGNAVISTAQSPFAGGSSAAFDGAGDYLTGGSPNSLLDLPGDFTIEAWVYTASTSRFVWLSRYTVSPLQGISLQLSVSTSRDVFVGQGNTTIVQSGSGAFNLSQWQYHSVVRSGSAITYRVGTSIVATATNSVSFVGSVPLTVGSIPGNLDFNGFLGPLRITKGVARDVSTVPTAPFPTGLFSGGDPFWANVVFLLQEGANGSKPATDQSQYAHALTWNGNAAFSTAQSPFAGGSSLALDGSGDFISISSQLVFGFGTGDLTVEFWVRIPVLTGTDTVLDFRPSANGGYLIFAQTNGIMECGHNAVTLVSSSVSLIANQWHHIALTRLGTTSVLYQDGVSVASAANTINYLVAPLLIGRNVFTTTLDYGGNIGPVRVTRGVARYAANFTPPTAPFPTGP